MRRPMSLAYLLRSAIDRGRVGPGSARRGHSTNARDRLLIAGHGTRIADAIACLATVSYTTGLTVLVDGGDVSGRILERPDILVQVAERH